MCVRPELVHTVASFYDAGPARVDLVKKRKEEKRRIRPSKKKHVSRPDFYKKESGRAFFLVFIISYCMLSLHIITFPQELLGQILVKRNIRSTSDTTNMFFFLLGLSLCKPIKIFEKVKTFLTR